jgi:hypothetical protein
MSNALFDFFSFFYFVVSLGIITLEYQNRRTKHDHKEHMSKKNTRVSLIPVALVQGVD